MRPTTITRHILRGRTAEKVATTATAAAASQAYYAMLLSSWARADDAPNMPPHNWAQSGFSRGYDACKYCGDYAGGYQHAYAAAVCYTLAIPQDALEGDPCNLLGVSAGLFGDRWLADGAVLTAVLSASAEPPAWAAMLADGTHSAALMAVTPNNTGADSAAEAMLEWEETAAPAYVHLVLRLADYTTVRGAWIEGSALLDQASVDLTFSREVAPDAGAGGSASWLAVTRSAADDVADPRAANWTQAFLTRSACRMGDGLSAEGQLAVWSAVTANFGSDMMTASLPADSGGASAPGAFLLVAADLEAVSLAAVRFYSVPPLLAPVSSLTLDLAVPAPPAGMRVGYAIYHIPGCCLRAALPGIDAATYRDLEFWRGGAAALSLGGATHRSSAIAAGRVGDGLQAGVAIPVSLPDDPVPALLCLAMHVVDVQQSPGASPLALYGSSLTPTQLTLE